MTEERPAPPLRIDVITLFPGMFPGPLAESITGRALERGLAVPEFRAPRAATSRAATTGARMLPGRP